MGDRAVAGSLWCLARRTLDALREWLEYVEQRLPAQEG
jgi:hypothetical protein